MMITTLLSSYTEGNLDSRSLALNLISQERVDNF